MLQNPIAFSTAHNHFHIITFAKLTLARINSFEFYFIWRFGAEKHKIYDKIRGVEDSLNCK